MATSATTLLVTGLLVHAKQHILLIVLLFFTSRIFYRRYLAYLSSYPGPPLAACTRLWKTWIVSKGHAETDYIELHRKYGNA